MLNALAPSGILVNEEGRWEHVFGDLSPFLLPMQGPNDPYVLNLVHPELRSPLHAAMIQATNEGNAVVYHQLPVSTLSQGKRVSLRLTPLAGEPEQQPAWA